jgi:hypothetical protein
MKVWVPVVALAVGGVLVAGPAAAAPVSPLAPLAVPRAQLGPVAKGLEVELLSGPTNNARAADDSFDPNDSAATVTREGRVTGYTLVYGDVGWTALRKGHGLLDVGTSVDLFRTARQAALYEIKSLHDLARVRGKNLQGVVVEKSSAFRVSGLGPGAVGLETIQRVGNHRLQSTVVDFQIDKFLCEAVINRADTQTAHAPVVAIARELARRIIAYAKGSLRARPVPLPRPLGSVKPGSNAPDLSAMVPTAADLKGRARVFQQAFSPDDNAITSYIREYHFGAKTGLFQLRATAELERTRREASGRLFVLRSVFTGPEAAVTLAHLVAPGATGVKLDGTQGARLGDESFATAASFTAQGQRLRAVIVYERRERVVGSVLLVGTAKKLTIDSALPYARMLDRRIRAALHPSLVA